VKRKAALLNWVQEILQDQDCYIKSASSDASFRSYWRAFSQSETYIVMDAPTEHEDCKPFINISQILIDATINAPIVIHKDLSQGFLLLTDLGSVQYLDILDDTNYINMYSDALNTLTNIQQKTSKNGLKAYDRALLKQEMELFNTWFIGTHLGIELTQTQINIIESCQELLINNALEQPQTFVHRDYHSRNLMHVKHNNPGVLDFQDAVIGPVTYDLVSLLKDCYISWDDSFINQFSDDFRVKYNQLNQTTISSELWQKWFDLMGMQRHLKAIGIFCRLNYRDNKPNYLKDINRTLCYVKRVCGHYSELKAFLTVLNDIIPSVNSICEQ